MNLTNSIEWLASLARQRAPGGTDEPDFADMGTAFGLDASLMALGAADGPENADAAPRLSAAAYAASLNLR
ncbi:hypothetical protein BH11PSE9_BH11PSE9_33710 [soil metagenome]